MLLIRHGGAERWQPPETSAYADEDELQRLLHEAPELVPGAGQAPTVWVREMGIPLGEGEGATTGSVDLVGVDAAGEITLVECKLRQNPESRRTVIGQALAYAAGCWRLSYERFDRAFAARAGGIRLAALVAERKPDGWDEESFRVAVADNLRSGRLRVVVAVDRITAELKQTILFLNEHTLPQLQILALELAFARDREVEIVIPVVFGEETKPPPPPQTWNEQALFDAYGRVASADAVSAARRLFDHILAAGATLSWGRGSYPSVTARASRGPERTLSVGFYAAPKNPSADVNFEYMRNAGVPEATLRELARRLGAVPGVTERLRGLEAAGFNLRPGLPIDEILAQPGAVERFMESLTWVLGEAAVTP